MKKMLLGLVVVGALMLSSTTIRAMDKVSMPEEAAAAEQQPDMQELEKALQEAMEQAGATEAPAATEAPVVEASVSEPEQKEVVTPVIPTELPVPTMPSIEAQPVVEPAAPVMPSTETQPMVEPTAPVMPSTEMQPMVEPTAPVMPGLQDTKPVEEPVVPVPVSMPGLE